MRQQKIGYFRDVLPSQLLSWVPMKLNLTQQKQTFTNKPKVTATDLNARLVLVTD